MMIKFQRETANTLPTGKWKPQECLSGINLLHLFKTKIT